MRRWLAGIGAATAAGIGGVLAAGALVGRREALDPDAIERPGSMFYLRGLGIHFVERGHGPALLLVHGFGASTFSFREQIGPFSERYRVIALDLPGFGYSDRPAGLDLSQSAQAERLREFLERMGIERAVVLGHSMGGDIAMRLAAAHPERVERLIVVAAPPPDRPAVPPVARRLGPLLPVASAVMFGQRRMRSGMRRSVYDPACITDEVFEEYLRPSRIRGSTAALGRLIADSARDAPLPPRSIATRTLLLWGEADPVVPLHVAHRLHAEMPDARLEVIPRAGHLVLEEQPEAANHAILHFLDMPPRREHAPRGGTAEHGTET